MDERELQEGKKERIKGTQFVYIANVLLHNLDVFTFRRALSLPS
jgi:hypothetical protein